MNNNAVINSKSPVLSKQRYERISNITGYNVVKSGILESFATLDNFLSTKTIRNYEFNLDREDFVVFKNQSIKAVANGSNQSLIGQTQSKDAYNIVNGSLEGEHYAGVFHSRKDIIDFAEMQVLERELGKQAESQLWSEFDFDLMGTINTNVGDGMKLNKGILDIITDVDNSLFSSNPIGSADYAKVYNLLCEKQIQINASNKLPNFNPVVVIVSGAKMQSLFLKSNITANSLISSLETMLIGMNIFPVYLSNLVDSRDYAIMLWYKACIYT